MSNWREAVAAWREGAFAWGKPMTGTRKPDDSALSAYALGDYGRWRGRWYAQTPTGLLAGLSEHQVTEHEDGTITVSPSILVDDGQHDWHGWLERGAWRSA